MSSKLPTKTRIHQMAPIHESLRIKNHGTYWPTDDVPMRKHNAFDMDTTFYDIESANSGGQSSFCQALMTLFRWIVLFVVLFVAVYITLIVFINVASSWGHQASTPMPRNISSIRLSTQTNESISKPKVSAKSDVSRSSRKRNEPNRMPLSEAFLHELRVNLKLISLNMTESETYCLSGTTLSECELDWPKVISLMAPEVTHLNVSLSNTGNDDKCFTVRDEITCFRPLEDSRTEVVLTKLIFNPGTLDVGAEEEQTLDANHVLVIDPQNYILITGDKPNEFCRLSLYGQACDSFEDLLSGEH